MFPKDRIHKKISALLAARGHLLNQQPSDIIAITQLTEMIVDLSRRPVLSKQGSLRILSQREEVSLDAALRRLDDTIKTSAGTSQIVDASSNLAGLPGDDCDPQKHYDRQAARAERLYSW
jgi:hypothetical protein